jgi:hypothetical protein
VNHDGSGGLSGWAYGANIGWILFDPALSTPPRVDVSTGELSGYAYSANVGWINLEGVTTCVEEGTDSDGDSIADAWEYEQLAADGQLADLTILTGSGDSDGDGKSDLDEYLADTNPFDGTDNLRITSFTPDIALGEADLTWATWSARRVYAVKSSTDLQTWTTELSGLYTDNGTVVKGSPLPAKMFFQVVSGVHLCP